MAIHVETFVSRAQKLAERGQLEAGLDLIYDSIDRLLRQGKFQELDGILAALPVPDCSLDVLLGVLTATLPARSRLDSRQALVARVEQSLRDRGEYEASLLAGLE